MTDQTNAPAVPVLPPGYFSNAEARADHFAATVKAIESAQPSAATPAATAPNAEDLAILDVTAKHKLPDGSAAILNPKFMGTIERLRAGVLGGQRLDRGAATAALSEVLGIPVPATPKAGAPIEPQGSPEDRAFEEAAARLDTGEFIPVSELPAEMLAGYRVELPDGFGLNGESVSMLRTAREAGIPQSVVDKFIRARIAEESEE
jgi:hypothetical protein